MKLKEYLLKEHTQATTKMYLRDIQIFLNYMTVEKALTAKYRDIMEYVDYLRKRYTNPKTISKMLYGVKAWYFYLVAEGKRNDHPCRFLTLKDAKQEAVQLQDLFTSPELERLLERKERYEKSRVKNQVIITLLIYQALRLKELVNLKTEDINLEEGTIYIREMPDTAGRTLKLKSNQVMLFYSYIHQVRPFLVKEETNMLLINLKGKPVSADEINYLISTYRNAYPKKKLTVTKIRQSVITNLFKEKKDLRVVQAFAGHKNPSSTEKYRQAGLEELKAAVLKHHPLG